MIFEEFIPQFLKDTERYAEISLKYHMTLYILVLEDFCFGKIAKKLFGSEIQIFFFFGQEDNN